MVLLDKSNKAWSISVFLCLILYSVLFIDCVIPYALSLESYVTAALAYNEWLQSSFI